MRKNEEKMQSKARKENITVGEGNPSANTQFRWNPVPGTTDWMAGELDESLMVGGTVKGNTVGARLAEERDKGNGTETDPGSTVGPFCELRLPDCARCRSKTRCARDSPIANSTVVLGR